VGFFDIVNEMNFLQKIYAVNIPIVTFFIVGAYFEWLLFESDFISMALGVYIVLFLLFSLVNLFWLIKAVTSGQWKTDIKKIAILTAGLLVAVGVSLFLINNYDETDLWNLYENDFYNYSVRYPDSANIAFTEGLARIGAFNDVTEFELETNAYVEIFVELEEVEDVTHYASLAIIYRELPASVEMTNHIPKYFNDEYIPSLIAKSGTSSPMLASNFVITEGESWVSLAYDGFATEYVTIHNDYLAFVIPINTLKDREDSSIMLDKISDTLQMWE